MQPNEDLENEIEALNSIYDADTLKTADESSIYVLSLPSQDTSLRIQFPESYPDVPPQVLGVQSSGEHSRRGEAQQILEHFRESIGTVFRPGEVCLYEAIEDLTSKLEDLAAATAASNLDEEADNLEVHDLNESFEPHLDLGAEAPPWTLSDVLIESKSVFIARCAPCTSPSQAAAYLQHLISTDKRVAKATHNITAHRIKGPNGTTFQDCDDDGESAAGGRLLHLLQLMDLWDVCVVVSRWYGGVKLGPARFGCINTAARDAFVKGGFVKDGKEKDSSGSAGASKKGKR